MFIMVSCAAGLGSSFMVRMNVQKILEDMGIEAEVEHSDLSTATTYRADIFVTAKNFAETFSNVKGYVIALDNIVDQVELKEKLIIAMDAVNSKK